MKIDSTGKAAVDPAYYWRPMTECPVGPKVILLNPGGVAVLGTYSGRGRWEGWSPLPKRQPENAGESELAQQPREARSAPPDALGAVMRTLRGFELIEFNDRYGDACSLQASSLAEYVIPGTSAVWLGPNGATERRMHLDRGQVQALINHLQNWLTNDSFDLSVTGAPHG